MTTEQLFDAAKLPGKPKRPVFLAVLCIHTWVGSLLLFYLFWREYAVANETAEIMKAMLRNAPMLPEAGGFYTYLRQQIFHSLVQMTSCVLCAAGAVAMWRRLKWGFYAYMIGELGSLAVAVWLIVSLHALRFDLLGVVLYVLLFVFPLGFITLYALNLKHLRK